MSWRDRSPWLMAPVAVLLFAAFAFGASQARRYDDPFNVQGLALFEALKRAEAERLNAVLKSRIGLETNDDALGRQQRDVEIALAELDASASVRPNGESAPLAARRRAMRLAIERENELVARFKSSNSLLSRSLAGLPTAAAAIGAGDDGATVTPAIERAQMTADDLLLATVLHSQHVTAVGGEEIGELLRRLDRDRAAVPASRRIPIEALAAEVETVLREQATVDATLAEIDALATGRDIEAARKLLADEGRRDAASAENWHRYLFVFSLTLIAMFVASAIYLVKSLGVIRRVNRALKDANEGLEQRVAGRTRELLEANQVLDRTGRIGGVGGWHVDVATMNAHWTDQTRRILDFGPGDGPTLQECITRCAPDARPTFEAAVAAALAGGKGFDMELPFVDASGHATWIRAAGEPQFDDGRVVGLIGAFQDITARRTMEAELRHGHDVLTTFMENLPCGLSVFDSDLRLIASNRQYRKLLHYPDSLLDGRETTLEDILRFNQARGDYDGIDAEAAIGAFLHLARHPPENFYLERARAHGHPLEIRGSPLPGGGFVLTHTDVSERLDAENKRLQSERLLRGAIDAVEEGFVLFDPEDRLLYCNETYRGTFREGADEIVPGVTFEHVQRLILRTDVFDMAVDPEAWIANRMAQHRAGDTMMVRHLFDGRIVRAIDRRTPDGHTVGFRADITELVRATDEAQAASLAKSQFLANMSHEIRTPMNAVLGMLTLLHRTALDERQADYTARADGAARSLLALLNDILDFSKAEAGKMVLDRQAFDAAALLRDVAVIASASVGAKPIRLLFDLDPRLPARLVGDALRLQQVLVNLLGNAIKFTEAGEVALSIAVAERTARSAVLEFAVQDTGIGIAADNHDLVFGRFTQAESSTTRRFGGTGLGLTISQRLVALMGGQLALESTPGAGSRFHFRIELDADDDVAPVAGDAVGSPVRLLLVDAHHAAREVVARAGRTLGWHVDVTTGAVGLSELPTLADAVGDVPFDAVVVSAEVALREPPAAASAGRGARGGDRPLRFVAGSQGDRDRLARAGHVEGAGFDAYLVEPVTPAVLRSAMAMPRTARPPSPGTASLAPDDTPTAGAVAARPKRLAPTRLLLVEDNVHNQQVARELLEDEGASVVLAGNGREALTVLSTSVDAFDIVLMDIQMPVMDGFTATRLIRGELALALPIVAMTANDTDADRDACLAAGMNDHVGKPFDLDALVACVLRHTGRAADTDAGTSRLAAVPAVIAAAADAGGIALDAALLRLGGNRSAYRRLLANVVEQLGRTSAAMRADAAPDTQRRRLHTLKGLAATLGATRLAASVSTAQERLQESDAMADVDAATALVCRATDEARPGLVALLAAWPLPPQTDRIAECHPLDIAALRAGLERIADHLRHADMAALEAIDALHDGSGRAPALEALRNAIADLDFERALALCEDLLGADPMAADLFPAAAESA